jgi:hypothetical protein
MIFRQSQEIATMLSMMKTAAYDKSERSLQTCILFLKRMHDNRCKDVPYPCTSISRRARLTSCFSKPNSTSMKRSVSLSQESITPLWHIHYVSRPRFTVHIKAEIKCKSFLVLPGALIVVTIVPHQTLWILFQGCHHHGWLQVKVGMCIKGSYLPSESHKSNAAWAQTSHIPFLSHAMCENNEKVSRSHRFMANKTHSNKPSANTTTMNDTYRNGLHVTC